jgi:hypothetical protein
MKHCGKGLFVFASRNLFGLLGLVSLIPLLAYGQTLKPSLRRSNFGAKAGKA